MTVYNTEIPWAYGTFSIVDAEEEETGLIDNDVESSEPEKDYGLGVYSLNVGVTGFHSYNYYVKATIYLNEDPKLQNAPYVEYIIQTPSNRIGFVVPDCPYVDEEDVIEVGSDQTLIRFYWIDANRDCIIHITSL